MRRYIFLKAAFNFFTQSRKSITWWREKDRLRDVCRKWLSRPTSMLFKEVQQDHSSSYLKRSYICTFTSTSTQTVGEGQGQILDVPYVKITLAMNSVLLTSMQQIRTLKKKKQEKGSLWGEYTVYAGEVWLCKFFSWCNYNKCSCHHISWLRATILIS